MKKVLMLVLTAVLAFSLAACGGEKNGEKAEGADFPMTVTDYLGTEMEFEAAPEKVVSLSPSCTEILYALGLGDKVVGVSNWCTYPEEAAAVEKVGDTFSVNVERIIEMDADVVFVSGAAAAESVQALNEAGINVYSIGAKNIDDICKSISGVGKVTGAQDQAEEVVNSMKEQLSALEEQVADLDVKRVFIDLGDLYSTGSEDYLGGSLSLIKAENIALDAGANSPQLSAETVIEKNPQVYFKNDQVYFIDYSDPAADKITRDGPRFIEGLEYLAGLIHGLEK